MMLIPNKANSRISVGRLTPFGMIGASEPFPVITNITPPTIQGNPVSGLMLSGDNGSWTNSSAITGYNYRWRSRDPDTGVIADYQGESDPTMLLDEEHVGYEIQRQVQAVSPAGLSAWASSGFVGPVSEAIPDPVFNRAALTAASRSIHSGHSLTDAYTYGHGWPGDLVLLRDSQMEPQDGSGDTYVVRSTIPGSPLFWRWDNGPSANTADARGDIASFESLMITEAGPPHTSVPPSVETLDYLIRFADNLVLNGAGNELIIWSIWPGLRGPGTDDANPVPTGVWEGHTFRTGLDEYYKSFKYLADYATWKMRQMHPELPDDWRAWMIPGDRWMARVYDDIANGLVPGISDIADLFADDIHPNDNGAYGLSCFAFTALYQIDLRGQAGVYAPDGLPSALRDYFWRIAWELATEYEPVGMGGSAGAALEFDSDADPDPLAPPDPGGDLPAHVIRWTPGDYDGPALTGAQPAVSGGELVFTGDPLSAEVSLSGYYFAARLKVDARPDQNQPFLLLNVNSSPLVYQKPLARTLLNFWMDPAQLYTQMYDSTEWEEGVGGGRADVGEYVIVEGWAFGSTVGCALNGIGDQTLSTTDPVPSTTRLNMFQPDGDPAGLDIRATGIFLSDSMPTSAERESVRAWLDG